MHVIRIVLPLALSLFCVLSAHAQRTQDKETGPVRSSAAYAEVLLRKTELQADIESFLADYTEENPTLVNARYEIAILIRDTDRMFAVKPSEAGKLTQALGKLIVRRAALATEYERLVRTRNKEHPELKRAKRKLGIFDAAIKEILG